jgi:hypothetical protein
VAADTFIPADTTREASDAQTEAYRRMGPQRRVELVFRLNAQARDLALAGIRARHPDYSEERVRFAWFRLKLDDDDLTRKVWPGRDLVDP